MVFQTIPLVYLLFINNYKVKATFQSSKNNHKNKNKCIFFLLHFCQFDKQRFAQKKKKKKYLNNTKTKIVLINNTNNTIGIFAFINNYKLLATFKRSKHNTITKKKKKNFEISCCLNFANL